MVTELALTLENYDHLINVITYSALFVGGFYIALHSRMMPTWLITCLWYIGVSSFLIVITIILELLYGQLFPGSYFLIGIIPETLLKISLLTTVVLLFLKTVFQDIKGSKQRTKL